MAWLDRLHAPHQPAAPVSTAALTDAFMEMEAAQSDAEAAVAKYRAATGHADIDQQWGPVRDKCYEASALYLTLTTGSPNAVLVQQGIDMLASVTGHIAAFRERHERPLAAAATALANATAAATRAEQAAAAAQATMTPQVAFCPSVWRANDLLTAALAELRAAHDCRRVEALAAHVTTVAGVLERAVVEAPQRVEEARRALSSISTRIEVARERLVAASRALSALLQDFSAPASADLVDNPRDALDYIGQACEMFGRARTAQHYGNSEEALDLARLIRRALGKAEELIDAVPERLRMLREVAQDPQARLEKVRFALRDAQMFAVDHGLAQRWGPILDAQLGRIQVLKDALHTTHPDYWAYVTGLDRVDGRIATAVAEMREALSSPGAPRRTG